MRGPPQLETALISPKPLNPSTTPTAQAITTTKARSRVTASLNNQFDDLQAIKNYQPSPPPSLIVTR
jgi:hypothetical protein